MSDLSERFGERGDKEAVETGLAFAPKFDGDGLIPVITTDHETREVLMFAFMNREALAKTLEIGEAVYYSRSRGKLWHKGEESGHVQKVKEILIDCDQDVVQLRVEAVGGASCHVGYRSCFFRAVPFGQAARAGEGAMQTSAIMEKVFDPDEVYGKK
ncbi:MAG: phosphoribosyl-AMP cyclohydrolase [Planctomycetaceae bacterium]|nr:phosphoribosyl-AMP cyclohydrolase [Planctomycetaceae bacterium]